MTDTEKIKLSDGTEVTAEELQERAEVERKRRLGNRVALAKKGGARQKLVEQWDNHPTNEREYLRMMQLRRRAYEEHAAELLAESPELQQFVEEMEGRHGPHALAHRNVVSWAAAFLIGRYGEAIDFWPTALTAEDHLRIERWDVVGFPGGIVPLDKDPAVRRSILSGHAFSLDGAKIIQPLEG